MNQHKTIVWVHGDALSPTNPALQAHPDAPAIFVWDEPLLQTTHISLKRILFMYESLLELPVAIRRGNVAEEVMRFAKAHDATMIATTETPAPRFRRLAQQIGAEIDMLHIYPIPPFVTLDGPIDLKRFSRYWRTARQSAFDYTTG